MQLKTINLSFFYDNYFEQESGMNLFFIYDFRVSKLLYYS